MPPAKRQPSPEGVGWNPDHEAARPGLCRGSAIGAAPMFSSTNKAASGSFYRSLDLSARAYLAGAEGLAGVVCVV
jgi:hypothetical protein